MVSRLPDEIFFDIFLITLQEHFCVCLKALSNELVSKDLT